MAAGAAGRESAVRTDAARRRRPDHRPIDAPFVFLARHRAASVALAFLLEACILVLLAYADPADVVGIPAAVAAAIAGTVAVVFGPWDGAAVAFGGALVFAAAGGWNAGELAALAAWPAIVLPVGLFARRVARQRLALREIVAAQEDERRRLAHELHDETAQALAAALMTLRRVERAGSSAELAASGAEARALIQGTIERIRALAVDLRPRALDDFGLATAAERLVSTLSEQTGLAVSLESEDLGARLAPDTELSLYRTLQEALLAVAARAGATQARVTLEQRGADVVLEVVDDGADDERGRDGALDLIVARERLRLVGGRLTVGPRPGAGRVVRASVPSPQPPGG